MQIDYESQYVMDDYEIHFVYTNTSMSTIAVKCG